MPTGETRAPCGYRPEVMIPERNRHLSHTSTFIVHLSYKWSGTTSCCLDNFRQSLTTTHVQIWVSNSRSGVAEQTAVTEQKVHASRQKVTTPTQFTRLQRAEPSSRPWSCSFCVTSSTPSGLKCSPSTKNLRNPLKQDDSHLAAKFQCDSRQTASPHPASFATSLRLNHETVEFPNMSKQKSYLWFSRRVKFLAHVGVRHIVSTLVVKAIDRCRNHMCWFNFISIIDATVHCLRSWLMSRRAQDTHLREYSCSTTTLPSQSCSSPMVVPKTKVTPTTPVNVVLRLHTYYQFEIKRNEAKPNWKCPTGSSPFGASVRPSALHPAGCRPACYFPPGVAVRVGSY